VGCQTRQLEKAPVRANLGPEGTSGLAAHLSSKFLLRAAARRIRGVHELRIGDAIIRARRRLLKPFPGLAVLGAVLSDGHASNHTYVSRNIDSDAVRTA